MDLQKMFGLGGIFSGMGGNPSGLPTGEDGSAGATSSGFQPMGFLQMLQQAMGGGQQMMDKAKAGQAGQPPVTPFQLQRPTPPSMMSFRPNSGGY